MNVRKKFTKKYRITGVIYCTKVIQMMYNSFNNKLTNY
jgi:hypothetical protein